MCIRDRPGKQTTRAGQHDPASVQGMEWRLEQQRQQLVAQHESELQLKEQQAAMRADEQRSEAAAAARATEERLTLELLQATQVKLFSALHSLLRPSSCPSSIFCWSALLASFPFLRPAQHLITACAGKGQSVCGEQQTSG